MQRRTRRQLERFFLLTGIGCVGIWFASVAGPVVYQDWGSWAFDRNLQGQPATVGEYLTAKKNQFIADFGPPPAPAVNFKPPAPPLIAKAPPPLSPSLKIGSVLGRLEVPRLHLSSMVREGAGETTLAIALGHIPGTAIPGHDGNVGVAGHRDKLFRGLKDIRANDLIRFETLSGTYSYRVEGTNIVMPRDIGVLAPRRYPELTLVTCYPFYYIGSAPKRFIVKARLENDPAPAEVAKVEAPEPVAAPARVVVVAQAARPKPKDARIKSAGLIFSVSRNHSRQLAPGVLIGLTKSDSSDRARGWVWLSGQRRTIWLREKTPVRIYGALDGRTRVLVITRITPSSITGYLAPSTT